jgi:hypothetical protein
MNQANDMEELLAAANLAKRLDNENDTKTARFTYNRQRTLIMENANG